MDQRLKNLEDLSELLTKEMVQQNKSMIDINKNLISEIKSLREAYVKQDEDFEEFKNLLRKIYDLNKQHQGLNQNQMPPNIPLNMIPPNMQQQQHQQAYSSQSSASNQQFPPPISINNLIPHGNNNLNNSYMTEQQVNQSMLNNLSFQSERTPLNTNQQNPNASCYSISSASAMSNQQHQQFTPLYNNMIPGQQQQLTASQKSAASYPTNVRPNQAQMQPQMPQQNNIPGPNFKPIPPPVQVMLPQQQMQQMQPQQTQQQIAQQQQKPFSFSNLNKPPVTTKNKPEERQIFNVPPPSAQTTSTPQPNIPFSKIQPNQDETNQKPPQFQFSPTKQTESTASALKPFGTTGTTASVPSIFGSNLFKTTATPEKKTPFFGAMTTTISQPLLKAPEATKLADGGENEVDVSAGANPEEFEPQLDFKPIVKLKEVETKTGEEDEDVLLKHRCKLFRFDLTTKEWKEKGLGDIKFLKNKSTGVIRILMRREQILKICANHRMNSTMTIKEVTPKQYSWLATDFADNEAKSELLLVKFKLVDEATEFKKEFEKSVEASKNLSVTKTPIKAQETNQTKSNSQTGTSKLSQLLKTDKWNCDACYAPNNKTDLRCACCSTVKPGETVAPTQKSDFSTTTSTNTTGNSQFSFGLKPDAQKQESPLKPFSFGSTQPATAQTKAPFSFGAPAGTSQPSKLDFSLKTTTSPAKETNGLFQPKALPTFETLAANSSTGGTKSLFGALGSSSPATNAFSGGIKAQPAKPLFGSTFQTPTTEAEDEGGAAENPEEYVPQVDFKPIVKLQEVETKTGEEDEIIVFKARSKLFRFDNELKEWKEKGTGEMKLLRHKDHNNMNRILMRRDQVLKICANHRITPDLKFEIFNEKQVRWHAEDYSEGTGKHEMLAARFKHESEAKDFKKHCEDALEILKSEPPKTPVKKDSHPPAKTTEPCSGLKNKLSDMFKTDGWKCDACYAPNKADVIKCACCQTLKPGATEPPATQNTVTPSFGLISLGANDSKKKPIIFGSKSTANDTKDGAAPKFDFGGKNMFGGPVANPIFGAKTEATPIFGAKSDVSFANLAQKTPQTGFGGGFGSGGFGSGGFGTGNQAKPLFGSAQPTITVEDGNEEGGAAENPEEYEPQVDFKPLVKLQEVETKTGEEDEEILYKNRCKLYRFNPELKEWKEKGVGDIKILKHKHKEQTYRVLMRREQVHKLCANHRINISIKLENMNEKQLTWYVQDCSEDGSVHPEILLAKFRHEEEATKFKVEFQKVQKILVDPNTPVSVPTKKIESDSDSVEIIATVEATKEQVEKARLYNLPDNFYLYEKCGKCKGCRGCERED